MRLYFSGDSSFLWAGQRFRSGGCFHFGLFHNWKSCERIWTKFLGRVGHGRGIKGINFGDDPDHRPDPGVRSPKSGFTGLSKKYLVDSDQSCIANLHCKNHSAILSCWRSAEVCALWILLVQTLALYKSFTYLHTYLQREGRTFVRGHFVPSLHLQSFSYCCDIPIQFPGSACKFESVKIR